MLITRRVKPIGLPAALAASSNKKIKRTVKSVTFFAEQKNAPLLPTAYFGVRWNK